MSKDNPKRIPRTVLPLRDEYIAVAHVLHILGNNIYNITEQEFIKYVMEQTRGSFNPWRAGTIYRDLMKEAGLEPLEDYTMRMVKEEEIDLNKIYNNLPDNWDEAAKRGTITKDRFEEIVSATFFGNPMNRS